MTPATILGAALLALVAQDVYMYLRGHDGITTRIARREPVLRWGRK